MDLSLSYSSQMGQNAVFGVLANRTSVENKNVSLVAILAKLEALADKLIGYKLAVELIHLAAKGSYMGF
jgi:hypothetical protein